MCYCSAKGFPRRKVYTPKKNTRRGACQAATKAMHTHRAKTCSRCRIVEIATPQTLTRPYMFQHSHATSCGVQKTFPRRVKAMIFDQLGSGYDFLSIYRGKSTGATESFSIWPYSPTLYASVLKTIGIYDIFFRIRREEGTKTKTAEVLNIKIPTQTFHHITMRELCSLMTTWEKSHELMPFSTCDVVLKTGKPLDLRKKDIPIITLHDGDILTINHLDKKFSRLFILAAIRDFCINTFNLNFYESASKAYCKKIFDHNADITLNEKVLLNFMHLQTCLPVKSLQYHSDNTISATVISSDNPHGSLFSIPQKEPIEHICVLGQCLDSSKPRARRKKSQKNKAHT